MRIQELASTGFLEISVSEGVGTITIARPSRKNAMTLAMWEEMARLFTATGETPDIRVAILTGAGGDFCAGADIGEFDTVRSDPATARAYEAANSAAFAAIRDCPVPTIAAISGVCFGGGFGLAAACDLRLATTDAMFAVPAGRLGLAYPVDAMADIVHAVGPQRAKYLTFSAARLDAAGARDTGFVMETVEPDRLMLRAAELAAGIAANAPLSVRASKASIRAALSGSAADAEHASVLGDLTFDSADYAEGRAAFREKRPPQFRGS